jgi:DNA-binding CsgD family transcriptional regulator
VGGGWPLVGRVEELQFVLDTLSAEPPRGVIVAGGLGVGKTRLAREAVAALEVDCAVEWLAATPSSSTIPFGALAHLLPDVAVTSPEDHVRLVRGITLALDERADGRPLVVGVDDAQWLDSATAAIVHQLAVSGTARVLLTLRTDEPAPDPIVACWKDGWADRLELQPLTSRDVDALVGTVLGRPVDRVTLDRLWSVTQGNPLFVHELLLSALESDAFKTCDGVLSWTGGFGPSTRLSTILESRLGRVSAAGRAVLGVLAVGEPLDLDVLTELCGVDAVVEVERAGLAMVDHRERGQVRFCHPLYGEALRQAMGTVERRRVMATLADAMADTATTSRAQLLRVALWRLESDTPAPKWLFTEAAEIANAVYDHGLAERLARRAVADGGGLRASLALGDALNRQGRCGEGLPVLEPLAARAESDHEHVAIAIARYFGLTTEFGFRAEFADVLLAAEQQVRDLKLQAFLRAQRATLLASAGRLDEAVALALTATEDESDEVTQLRAVPALASAWMCGGRADAACALTERMLEPALRRREEMPQAPGWVLSLWVPSLAVAGQLDEADAAADFVDAGIRSGGGASDAASFLALARGMSALYRGRARTAVDRLTESAAGMRPIARWRLPFVLVQLTEACALIGDVEGACRASEQADELVAHHAIFDGLARRARGWMALARGQQNAAIDLLLEAAEWSGPRGQRTAELLALHDAVRLGAADQATPRLCDVASSSEGRWAPRFAAHAIAAVNDDGEALEAAADGFEELGALLLAAEATAEASAAFRRSGRRSRAERCAARTARLTEMCEGARTPLLDEFERPLPLTRREREVANLAAAGLSSQAIADRLYLSVRTVEGHLHNAYGKLGVNERRSLRRLMKAGVDDT